MCKRRSLCHLEGNKCGLLDEENRDPNFLTTAEIVENEWFQKMTFVRNRFRVADGVGTPEPDPGNFVKLVFPTYFCLILHFSKLVIWGSSWGRGFRISSVTRARLAPWAGRAART